MFSGIVAAKALIKSVKPLEDGIHLVLEVDTLTMLENNFLNEVKLGDSISINGCCLTVVNKDNNLLSFDLSKETLNCTSFCNVKLNEVVNLEKALVFGARLDGHMVSGHVDKVLKVINKEQNGESLILSFEFEKDVAAYIVPKGSVCINGVSLTVNQVLDKTFTVNLIPFTQQATNLSELEINDMVNFEIDMIAKYIVRSLELREKV